MSNNKTLIEWLSWMKALHVKEIDLSLERVAEIATRLDLLKPNCPVITVAGTNGKGSCVAGLEAIYLASGYKVGVFTTPFLFTYNEQVRLQGKNAEDHLFCDAFQRITEACGNDIRLTLFEYGTLAAFLIFKQANLDIWILEVGLGGRWDAVNVLDADIAIVSSIGIDHTEYLGDTREAIAYEKAGIFRAGKPAVCGDFNPPKTLIDYASHIGSFLFCQHIDFGYKEDGSYWTWWSQTIQLEQLPKPILLLQNMSTVLMAVELIQLRMPVKMEAIHKALSTVNLPGRIQEIVGQVTEIYDVSHNPAAVTLLANHVKNKSISGKTYAVFSMLADKDIPSTLKVIKPHIDKWHIAAVSHERAASLEKLLASFKSECIQDVVVYGSIKQAYDSVKSMAKAGDRILVFGSFRTVAETQSSNLFFGSCSSL